MERGVLLVCRRPRSAGLVSAAAALVLRRRWPRATRAVPMAELIVGKGLVADVAAVGHTLRREWWPLGFVALETVRGSRLSRAAAACMLGPVAYEWLRQRPDVDPLRDAGLRLVEDASHGSGVLVSAVRARSVALLRPEVRLPWARPITTHSDRWPHVRWGRSKPG